MEQVKATTEAVACSLGDRELRERAEELRPRLLERISSAQETEDGYLIGFAPGSIDAVREFVAFESRCCSFMTYTIDDGEDGTWLRLEGPDGTREFVRDLLSGRILEREDRGGRE